MSLTWDPMSPFETLWYKWDFSADLDGDTLSSVEQPVGTDVTVQSYVNDPTSVSVQLTAGVANAVATVLFKVHLTSGDELSQTVEIFIDPNR